MSGNNILLDTNAVLYALGGKLDLETIPDGVFSISFVTELELLSYPKLTKENEELIEQFLSDIEIIEMNQEIKRETIHLRKNHKLKLPDALICATSLYKDATLLTYDKKLKKVNEINVLVLK
ncbi:MAG: type II toxin-antitoxin system VapC family toxin [Ignavibacteria bacterium]|nr:type II toxin-antitoxin system VapC family toxin [Ignavibacteria bacterium]